MRLNDPSQKKKNRLVMGLVAFGGFFLACILIVIAILVGVNNLPPGPLDTSGYYMRGGKVFYNQGFPDGPFVIGSADFWTFKILRLPYAKDKRQVYFSGSPISGADPASFELLPEVSLAKDRNHVYAGLQVVSDDPVHFEFLGGPFAKDRKYVYWSFKVISEDPTHFVLIKQDGEYWYGKDMQTVYIQGNPIRGADPKSFRPLQGAYAQDQQHIFYFDERITSADAATFRVIASPYAQDAQHVFWMQHLIGGADPNTFKILNLAFQCTADQKQAYYQDLVIPNTDPAKFPPGEKATNCTASDLFFSP